MHYIKNVHSADRKLLLQRELKMLDNLGVLNELKKI